jgi:hypothetical protein
LPTWRQRDVLVPLKTQVGGKPCSSPGRRSASASPRCPAGPQPRLAVERTPRTWDLIGQTEAVDAEAIALSTLGPGRAEVGAAVQAREPPSSVGARLSARAAQESAPSQPRAAIESARTSPTVGVGAAGQLNRAKTTGSAATSTARSRCWQTPKSEALTIRQRGFRARPGKGVPWQGLEESKQRANDRRH